MGEYYNVVASIATVVSTCLALWQYWKQRLAVMTERERIVQQKERLRTAVSVAVSGYESVNLIIQRGKEDDATIAELQNIARPIRTNLLLLTRVLERETSLLDDWEPGSLTASAAPPAATAPNTGEGTAG